MAVFTCIYDKRLGKARGEGHRQQQLLQCIYRQTQGFLVPSLLVLVAHLELSLCLRPTCLPTGSGNSLTTCNGNSKLWFHLGSSCRERELPSLSPLLPPTFSMTTMYAKCYQLASGLANLLQLRIGRQRWQCISLLGLQAILPLSCPHVSVGGFEGVVLYVVRAWCVYWGDFVHLPTCSTVKCICFQAVKGVAIAHTALCPLTISPLSLSMAFLRASLSPTSNQMVIGCLPPSSPPPNVGSI